MKQCEFSGQLLPKDSFLLQEMARTKGGWVRLSVLAAFPRLQSLLASSYTGVLAGAIERSSTLELSSSRTEVRRIKPLPGAIGAMARGQLVLLMHDEWVHAVWKDEEGYLHEEVEKNQQAQQLGCIAESDVDAYFEDGSVFPGAIDLRSKALEKDVSEEERTKALEERMARTLALQAGLGADKACRWGEACPRLSTDAEHTASAHTAAQARLAESQGATEAVRALGGRWMTDADRQSVLTLTLHPDPDPDH